MEKKIYTNVIATFVACFFFLSNTKAADATAPAAFISAKQEIENMLSGKTPLSFERAIFLTENAYYNNQLPEKEFTEAIDFHIANIQTLIKANRTKTASDFQNDLRSWAATKAANYETALANYCIFTYLTDTTAFVAQNKIFLHLPYTYSHRDPLGTLDWSNTQVSNLLFSDKPQGNCFALASLFKIFSERLNSKAILCTAPGHIYIRHADENGTFFNVELSSQTFPGSGTLSVVTYTTDQAMKSGIAQRTLDLKQSVALCLIYLAKGYEQTQQTKTDNFVLQCAELAYQAETFNLNALLLKAEVLEARLLAKNKTVAQLQSDKQFLDYQKHITHLFNLGYREMPSEQKRMIIEKLRNPEMVIARYNAMQEQSKQKSFETRKATLSWGLFDEEMETKPTEVFGRTAFSSSTKKIAKFLPADTAANYPIDLIVFAWQVDPLAAKYPDMSPYSAFANNPIAFVDNDGRKVTFFGDAAAFTKFKTMIEKEFAGKVIVSMNSKNELSFTKAGKLSMTNQIYLFSQLQKYAKSGDDIQANVGGLESDFQRETIIDNYPRSFFDLHDNEVLSKSTSNVSVGANFLHFLTEQYHKQIELGLTRSDNTDDGYEESHPRGIAEEFKAGAFMLADATDMHDNTLNGKELKTTTGDDIQTFQYSLVDKDQNLVGKLTVKLTGGSILQSSFDNSGSDVGKKYEFHNSKDKAYFAKAKQILNQ